MSSSTPSEKEIRDECVIEEVQYRIAHPILQPLPLEWSSVGLDPSRFFHNYDDAMHQFGDILRAHNVVIHGLELTYRTAPRVELTEDTKVTLLIQSTDFNKSEWSEAVVQVAKKVAQLRNDGGPTIIVELVDYRALNPFTFPIARSDGELNKAWDKDMGPAVMNSIREMKWQIVSLQHRGIVPNRSECQKTICISAWDASSPRWIALKATISHIGQPFNLAVEVTQAQPLWDTDLKPSRRRLAAQMDPDIWSPDIWLGQSVGSASHTSSVGGTLTLRDRTSGTLTPAILTSSLALPALSLPPTSTAHPLHSTSPADTTAKLESLDLRIATLKTWLHINAPSRAELASRGNTSVADADLHAANLAALTAERARIAAAPALLGHVFATRPGPRGWSLATLAPPRRIDNAFPIFPTAAPARCSWQVGDVPGWSAAKAGGEVMKCGRGTGWTVGRVGGARGEDGVVKVYGDDGQETFAEKGDEGAWVFDAETGAWVGVVVGEVWMVEAEAVVRDVESVTGMEVVEPRMVG